MAMALITAENARTLQAKGVESRLAKKQQRLTETVNPAVITDKVAKRIAHAIDLRLDKLDDPDTPAKECQALAAAVRALRETYHLVTGQPLPGRTKPEPKRQSRYWERPAPTPSYSACGPGPTTNGSPETQRLGDATTTPEAPNQQ